MMIMMIDGINADNNIINEEPSDERRRGLPREYFMFPVPQILEQCFLATFPRDVFRVSLRNRALNK
jgi:hypothetical protein